MNKFLKNVLIRLGVVATVAATMGAVVFAAVQLVKKQSPQTSVKAAVGKVTVMTEAMAFYNGTDKIEGMLYRPQNAEGLLPAVIYCQNNSYGDRWCREIAAKGYIAYCFEMGEGEKERTRTLKTIIKNIRDHRSTDKSRVYLMAEGNGCPVACSVAFAQRRKIAGLMLVSPGFNPLEVYKKAKTFPYPILVVDSALGMRANIEEIVSYIER